MRRAVLSRPGSREYMILYTMCNIVTCTRSSNGRIHAVHDRPCTGNPDLDLANFVQFEHAFVEASIKVNVIIATIILTSTEVSRTAQQTKMKTSQTQPTSPCTVTACTAAACPTAPTLRWTHFPDIQHPARCVPCDLKHV